MKNRFIIFFILCLNIIFYLFIKQIYRHIYLINIYFYNEIKLG